MKYREAYFEAMYTLRDLFYPYISEEIPFFKSGCYTKEFMRDAKKAERLLKKEGFGNPPFSKGTGIRLRK